jgi:hypothetical protein
MGSKFVNIHLKDTFLNYSEANITESFLYSAFVKKIVQYGCALLHDRSFRFVTLSSESKMKSRHYEDEEGGGETLQTKKTKLNSMVLVRERTIPTERTQLVGEVIANFCG